VWDELDEPLGFASGAAAAPPVRRKRPLKGVAISASILAIAVGLFTLSRRDLSINGEPFAIAKVEVSPAPQRAAAPETTASVRQTPAPPVASAEQMEGTSGVKVTRGTGGPPKPLIIDVAQALGVKLAPAPDPRLVEKSKYGLLPRIGSDGARPIDVYARAAVSDSVLRASGPRIALVVGGFDLAAEGPESAITKLPGAITLAVAPTGAAVEQQAAQARAAGHETVLQARLDDFSHSTNDLETHAPGTSASGAENLDSLRWQMGRFRRSPTGASAISMMALRRAASGRIPLPCCRCRLRAPISLSTPMRRLRRWMHLWRGLLGLRVSEARQSASFLVRRPTSRAWSDGRTDSIRRASHWSRSPL
jgi:hypothetical protein